MAATAAPGATAGAAAPETTADLDICDNAAKVAHVGKVQGITVEAGSGKEVSIGVKGSPCIGEP